MTAPRSLPVLRRRTVQVPAKESAAHWTYGTSIIWRPGTTEVLLTLPSAASRAPWGRLDVASGDLTIGTAMPGPLRAAYFPPPDAEDPRWWVLGLHGVGRVRPDGPPAVHDVVRTGIGRYPRRLFELGADHVAIGTDLSSNVTVLSKTSGTPVGRMRLPKGGVSIVLDSGLVRVFAPEQGTVYDVDPTPMKVRRRHRIVPGKGPCLVGETVHYLAGQIRAIPVLAPGDRPEPGVPVVVGAGAGSTVGSTVVARELAGLDVRTLAVAGPGAQGTRPVVPTAVEVLGVDAEGNVAIGTQEGFALIDVTTGTLLAEHVEPGRLVGAGMAQGHNTVALATTQPPLGTVVLVSW